MKGTWLALAVLVVVSSALLSLSCGRDQQLVSITIQPGVETVGATNIPVDQDAGFQVQLRALGNYIHPPVTKDITNQVTWVSNTPEMFTVDSTGLLTATGLACGGTLVSATATTNSSSGGISSSGAIVTGYMTANVVCFTGTAGSGPALTVTFGPNGSGTVSGSPGNFLCSSPNACVGQFAQGTTVSLQASPASGSSFQGWVGCDTPTATNPCSVNMNENRTVTVNFD